MLRRHGGPLHLRPERREHARGGGSWLSAVLLLGLAVLLHRVPPGALDRRGGYLLLAVVGALLCCGMNYATGDPSAGAQAFLAFPVPDGDLLAVSVSLGVAHAPSHARGLEELYAAADAALYAAKRAGRGRVEVAGVS